MIEINTLSTLIAALIAAVVAIISYAKGHDTGLAKGKAAGYSMGRIDTIRAQMSSAASDQMGSVRAAVNSPKNGSKVRPAVNKKNNKRR